jgi:Uma2 family endonuclease
MLARVPDRMTGAEYLAWEERQDKRWELVGGRPVLRAERKGWITPEGVAGGSYLHAMIKGNIDAALRARLRGGPCRSLTSDLRIRVSDTEYRYPDVVVDCGPASTQLYASQPRVVFEVLSPANTRRDQDEREDDFKLVGAVQQIVFVDSREPFARAWTRAGDLWPTSRVQGLDAALSLSSLGLSIPLHEVYEGWRFPPA